MSQLDVHKEHLQQHCRVCLQKLGRVHYACSSTTCKPLLLSCMGIDTTQDRGCVHPQNTCNNCYAKMKKSEAGALSSTLIPFPFREHGTACNLCTHFYKLAKGGRPRKPKKIPPSTVRHLAQCAGPKLACSEFSLSRDRFLPPSPGSPVATTDLECQFCHCIVDQPLELPCKATMCMNCLLWVAHRGYSCPKCGVDHEPTSASATSSVFTKVLLTRVLQCICGKQVQLQHLRQHIVTGCRELVAESPEALTVQDILQQPLNAPTTSLEKRTAGHLVRKMLLEADTGTISLPTGGHVSIIMYKLQ